MTVTELIAALQQADPNATVILFGSSGEYGEHILLEPAREINEGIYSGNAAIYITDGS